MTHPVDLKIIRMRKEHAELNTIFNMMVEYEPYCHYDEQICLAHILNVCCEAGLYVSIEEIRNFFNRYYNCKLHLAKNSYLKFLYGLNPEKLKKEDEASKKHASLAICSTKEGILAYKLGKDNGNLPKTSNEASEAFLEPKKEVNTL